MWYEDGKVYVAFPPAKEALVANATRNALRVKGENGELITQDCFDVEDDGYLRITVEGPDRKRVYANVYFFDEILI